MRQGERTEPGYILTVTTDVGVQRDWQLRHICTPAFRIKSTTRVLCLSMVNLLSILRSSQHFTGPGSIMSTAHGLGLVTLRRLADAIRVPSVFALVTA